MSSAFAPNAWGAWQPEPMAGAADRLRALLCDVEAVLLSLVRSVGALFVGAPCWLGPAAVRCRGVLDGRQAVLRRVTDHLVELATLLDQAAAQLGEALAHVRAAQLALDETTTLGADLAAAAVPLAWSWWQGERQQALDQSCLELVELDQRLSGSFDASIRAARALRREHDAAFIPRGSLTAALADGPEGVADWWATRTPSERRSLLREDASELGRLDGLPAAVRDLANRTALTERLTAFDAARASPSAQAAHAVDEAVEAELDRLAVAEPTGEILLLIDEPDRWEGKGRAAIAIGDPDTATNVAYLVPGLDDQVVTSLAVDDVRAEAVVRASVAAGGASTSAVAWLGYDTPTATSVMSPRQATEGAALLGAALAGTQASRGSADPHLTVIGHSYGSTTSALAVRRVPELVDDLVLVGSPGAEATAATELPVPLGHVWVGAAEADLVTRLGWFGPDPAAAAFGAQRFAAEVTRPGSGAFYAHGHYLDDAGQSLAQVGRIVAGLPDAVVRVPGR